ncbi:hypothetical protein [Marivita sp. S2033]
MSASDWKRAQAKSRKTLANAKIRCIDAGFGGTGASAGDAHDTSDRD